jgi:ABC-type sugar transport system ATPase subunit
MHVSAVTELLSIGEILDRRPNALSAGQRRRVALGRVLVSGAAVVLLDEPFAHLDTPLRAELGAELRRVQRALKMTMLFVSHDQTEAMRLADRVAVLDHGRLAQVGTPGDVYERPASRGVAEFFGSPRMNVITGVIESRHFHSGTLTIELPEPVRNGPGAIGIRPERLTVLDAQCTGAATVSGWVRAVDDEGADRYVRVDTELGDLIVRSAAAANAFTVGQAIGVRIDLNHIAVFTHEVH